jgi:signal transduction histidine kinase
VTSEVRHNLFLAFKEALHNIVKHAAATEVQISLERRPDGFVLLVADNGRGFDPGVLEEHPGPGADPARSSTGNGLHNMQRRLAEVGGRCEWDTAPHEGTRVRFIVRIHPSS